MHKRALSSARKIFSPILGDIMWALVSIISYSTFEYLDPFGIAGENSSNISPLIYVFPSLLMAFLFVYVFGLIIEAASTISFVNKYIGTTPNIVMKRAFIDERSLFVNGSMGGTITPGELSTDYEERYINSNLILLMFLLKTRKEF